MQIVKMEKKHIDDILVLENLSFAVPWSRTSFEDEVESNERAVYYCVIEGGRAVGYCGMWVVIDEGQITNIAVHPDFRRRGFGKALLSKVIEYCKNNSIRLVTIEVRKSNFSAIKLYKENGFKIVGERKGYYSDNKEDAILMNLEI